MSEICCTFAPAFEKKQYLGNAQQQNRNASASDISTKERWVSGLNQQFAKLSYG